MERWCALKRREQQQLEDNVCISCPTNIDSSGVGFKLLQ